MWVSFQKHGQDVWHKWHLEIKYIKIEKISIYLGKDYNLSSEVFPIFDCGIILQGFFVNVIFLTMKVTVTDSDMPDVTLISLLLC